MMTFWRIAEAGLRNFLRNAWLSTAATAMMTVTLTMVLVSFIANNTLNTTIKGVVNKIDFSMYLKDSTTPQQIKDLQSRLEQTENVQSVFFVSKAEALKRYRQDYSTNKGLTDAVDEANNPFPASFEVKAKDPNKLDPIATFAARSDVRPLLDDKTPTTYSGERKATIDRIISVSNIIKNIGLIASIVFAAISILIIFNTIRMAIYTRRDEIEIMKLVGATDWFIRGPFLFEAALYGAIATAIAVGFCYLVLLSGAAKLANSDLAPTIAIFRTYPGPVILSELLIGLALGGTSSLLAMRRYLKL